MQIITTGHQRLQPLFECLLTILCNISPYLKSMSMTAACKLMHLVEAFSTPWFLLANKTNHKLVFFLLEMLNNLVQYQFDGNSNLAYTMIRKRNVFHQLANLPTDCSTIQQTVSKKSKKQPLLPVALRMKAPPAKKAPTKMSSKLNSLKSTKTTKRTDGPMNKDAHPGGPKRAGVSTLWGS